jgi:hypothetical protein
MTFTNFSDLQYGPIGNLLSEAQQVNNGDIPAEGYLRNLTFDTTYIPDSQINYCLSVKQEAVCSALRFYFAPDFTPYQTAARATTTPAGLVSYVQSLFSGSSSEAS